MPKVNYAGKTFDSELEVEYYKHLKADVGTGKYLVEGFIYHPAPIKNLVGKRSYTPDFLIMYADHHVEIVECKGYNPYSKMIDDQIHNVMLSKSDEFLLNYVLDYIVSEYEEDEDSGLFSDWMSTNKVVYRKIKYLKAYGFVDWDFKNPNTLANKRKEKIIEQKDEIKELRDFKKDAERYFRYHLKIVDNEKLTKPQREWYMKYVEEIRRKYKG